MSRYIDADALHDALKEKQLWVVRCGDKHNEGYTYDQVHFAIDDAPSIDIEPKRGEWIKHDDERDYCSRCKHIFKTRTTTKQDKWTLYIDDLGYNYCPNCGADMRERESE